MKKYILISCISIGMLLSACGGSDDKEDIPVTYTFQSIEYTLHEGDGLRQIVHNTDVREYVNYTNTETTVQYEVDVNKDLAESSQFVFSQVIPKEISLSFKIKTPKSFIDNEISAYDADKWMFNEEEQMRTFASNMKKEKIVLDAKSRTIIEYSCVEQFLQVTFTVKFRNNVTGQIVELKGKWEGTLEFNNFHTNVSYQAL